MHRTRDTGVHRIDVTKSFLVGCTKSVHNYVLNIYFCVTNHDKKVLFSDLGSIRKDQTLLLLLGYEKGAKESF